MGRPPSCGCHCDAGAVPPPPDTLANFFVINIVDEAYTSYANPSSNGLSSRLAQFLDDLTLLRNKEQTIGRVNMVILQPERSGALRTDGTALLLKPPSYSGAGVFGLPEEVVYLNQITRNSPHNHTGTQAGPVTSDRDIMAHITNNLIRGKYDCIGVLIDDSGSMKRKHVEDLIDEWYWNISTNEASHAEYTRYIVDGNDDPWPLPSCSAGVLGLSAVGCVYESLLPFPERWLKYAAENAQTIFDHPNGCTGGGGCLCTGWSELCDVISDPTETPATVTFNYSFIQAGTKAIEDDGAGGIIEKTCVTLEDIFGGDPSDVRSVTNAMFKTEIAEALAVWKAAFENICSWLTVNFVNLGDETTTDIPSSAITTHSYSLPQGNIGDIRFGMHPIDGQYGSLGHAYYPGGVLGSTGNVGGDVHFDVGTNPNNWRLDENGVDEIGETEAISIKAVTVHELGHVFGIGHLSDPTAIMYPTINSTTYYDGWPSEAECGTDPNFTVDGDGNPIGCRGFWPDGIVGSPADLAALKAVYCVS